MRIITAVEQYERHPGDVFVFLAGGITNCWEWQDEVIKELQSYADTDTLVVFNPRRKNFPIHDPNASQQQITWEFEQLEQMDIFSMYFCNSDSDQPICMYELGRNLVKMQNKFPDDWEKRIIISVEDGYRRTKDVEVQTSLATKNKVSVLGKPSMMTEKEAVASMHAICIYQAYKTLRK